MRHTINTVYIKNYMMNQYKALKSAGRRRITERSQKIRNLLFEIADAESFLLVSVQMPRVQ